MIRPAAMVPFHHGAWGADNVTIVKVLQRDRAWKPRGEAPADGRPTVVLIERDPYLAFLLRLHVPEADVVEVEPDADPETIRDLDPALVVMGIDGQRPAIEDLMSRRGHPKIIAVLDSGGASARSALPSALDGVLARPFAPSDLARAVRGALGLGPVEEEGPAAGQVLVRMRSWLAPARIAALAVAAVLEVAATGGVADVRAWILALAFTYATVRWVLRRPNIVADIADVVVAAAIVASTGALDSNYIAFAVVSVAGVGLVRGPAWGVVAGVVVVAASSPVVVADVNEELASVREAVAWGLLYPLVGTTGGFASRVWRKLDTQGLNVLVEANRVLSSLYRIARTLPGGLEIGSVAEAAMHEIRDAMGARAGAVLLADAGTFAVVGSFGLADPSGVLVRSPEVGLGTAAYGDKRILRREHMHPGTAEALGAHECWLAAPMRRDDIPQGLLLAACPDEDAHQSNLALLMRLADEAAVAVENARLFSRVREISIDEERRRLARELHDGVAQSLTHLRYELDFITRHAAAADPVKKEVQRLARVAERTAADVRSMIMGLRASVSQEGLVGALRSYVADLRRLGGPDLVFDARGEVALPGDIEAEIFRVGQEALSNALRHAQANTIEVRLTLGATHARLMVDDDGVGLAGRHGRKKGPGGVGMNAMSERAELIGGTLEVTERPGGGTRVMLEYPIGGKR